MFDINDEDNAWLNFLNKLALSPLRKPLALLCVAVIIIVIAILLILAYIKVEVNKGILETIQNLCFALIFPPMGYIFSSTMEANKDKAIKASMTKLFEKYPDLLKQFQQWNDTFKETTTDKEQEAPKDVVGKAFVDKTIAMNAKAEDISDD